MTNTFDINEITVPKPPGTAPQENLKNVRLVLPPGNIANAAAYPRCPQAKFPVSCGKDTIIGTVTVSVQFIERATITEPVYNLDPPPGMPLQFGFAVVATRAHINFRIRNGTDYGATAELVNLTQAAPLYSSTVRIWGDPADPSHDAFRGGAYPDPQAEPLLSNPTRCGVTQVTELGLSSWQHVDTFVPGTPSETPAMTGCNEVEFNPTIEAKPTTNLADSPSGLEFDLNVPQNQDPNGSAVAHVRDTKLKLPPSLTVNASSANGLGACTPEQIGLLSPTDERQYFHFDSDVAKSFSLSYGGQSTAAIPAAAGAAVVADALETLPGLAGNVKVDGAPGAWIVTFVGGLVGADIPELIAEITYSPHQQLEVTGEGGGFNLQAGGKDTEVAFEASFPPGQVFIFPQSPSHELRAGETIVGPGIAPGTKITLANSFITIIDTPTIAETQNGTFRTVVPYNATGKEVQEALESLPSVGPGNVLVHDAGIVDTTHSYRILFVGSLAGGGPAVTTTTTALTGAGAGATIGAGPTAPEPLPVATIEKAKLHPVHERSRRLSRQRQTRHGPHRKRSGRRPPPGRVRLSGQPRIGIRPILCSASTSTSPMPRPGSSSRSRGGSKPIRRPAS